MQGVEPGSQITARPSFRRAFDRRRRTTVPAPHPYRLREGGCHRGRRGRASGTKLARFERVRSRSSCQRPEVRGLASACSAVCGGAAGPQVSVSAPRVELRLASPARGDGGL